MMRGMRWTKLFVAVAMVLVIPATVKAAEPSATQASLTLDQGFVGHPVSLDVLDGAVTISWDANTLVAPSGLIVSLGEGSTSTPDQRIAAPSVHISFDTPSAIAQTGSFTVSVKAHDLPTSSEQEEAGVVIDGSATTTIVQGTFKKEHVSFRVPAVSAFTISPTYRNGVMHSGFASWYAFKKCLCAASPDVPKGTRLIVRRVDDPSRYVIVTVNDWGPERDKFPDRAIDLDKVAFKRIGNTRGGVLAVTVDVVPQDDPLWKKGDELPPPNMKKLLAALKASLR
jgi:rare lipoprotein A (peptidoglycan hydrolase)